MADELSTGGAPPDGNERRPRRCRLAASALIDVCEAVGDGLLICDSQGRLTHANACFVSHWRLPQVPRPGSRVEPLILMLDSLAARVGELATQMPLPPRNGPVERQQVRLHDGRVIEWYGLEVSLPDGSCGRAWCFRDVSAQAATEHRLRENLKFEAIGRLSRGIGHDFNNILFVITSACDVLRLRIGDDQPQAKKEIEDIRRAAIRGADLTRRLQAFSRQRVLKTEELDLNEVIAGIQESLERFLGDQIHLEVVLAPALDRVRADRGSLEQVMVSLVANACDAMPAGGRVVIETANVILDEEFSRQCDQIRPGPYVLLAVGDTGTGLDDTSRSQLFEPFSTTKPVGSGLGLATVHGIVRQHHGVIQASTAPNKGTVFEIYLPRADLVQPAMQAAPQSALPRGDGLTILVVEEQPIPLDFASNALSKHGYGVLCARHAEEALDLAKHHAGPIHVVLTDAMMPRMSGAELYVRLRKYHPGLRVILTSRSVAGIPEEFQDGSAGVFHLDKPFTVPALLLGVAHALRSVTPLT